MSESSGNKKQVQIAINTRTKDADAGKNTYASGSNNMNFVTQGDFYIKDGAYHLVYNESEVSGMEGTTTYIKVKDGVVTLNRYGSLNSRFIFKKGEHYFSTYATQYGTFNVSLFTDEIEDKLYENGGTLNISYKIEIDGLMDEQNIDMMINVRVLKSN